MAMGPIVITGDGCVSLASLKNMALVIMARNKVAKQAPRRWALVKSDFFVRNPTAELSTGRMDPRVGSGRVGSGWVGSRFCRILAGRVGSGQHLGFFIFLLKQAPRRWALVKSDFFVRNPTDNHMWSSNMRCDMFFFMRYVESATSWVLDTTKVRRICPSPLLTASQLLHSNKYLEVNECASPKCERVCKVLHCDDLLPKQY